MHVCLVNNLSKMSRRNLSNLNVIGNSVLMFINSTTSSNEKLKIVEQVPVSTITNTFDRYTNVNMYRVFHKLFPSFMTTEFVSY